MKSHVWRPLYVVICLIMVILLIRLLYVPDDFGIHEKGYMYGWYSKSNEDWWKGFKVKYKFNNSDYCQGCHTEIYTQIMTSPHGIINCENCHGPAFDHPSDPSKLMIDRKKEQCLRCHYYLPYPTSGRGNIKGIDPEKHNPGIECVMCHNPHKPDMGGM